MTVTGDGNGSRTGANAGTGLARIRYEFAGSASEEGRTRCIISRPLESLVSNVVAWDRNAD